MGLFVRNPLPEETTETTAEILPFNAPRGIRGSAQRIRLNNRQDVELLKLRSQQAWQRSAWDYFKLIGEISFAFTLLSNVTSRARLYPAFIVDPHQPPVQLKNLVESGDLPVEYAEACQSVLNRLSSSTGGQAAILQDATLNLSVPGECYLVQTPERLGSGEPESWDIKSVDEVQVSPDGKVRIKPRAGATQAEMIDLPNTAFVGRIWRADPQYSQQATSSMLGVLQSCEDLLLFSQATRATARSRLNSGAMFVPDGLSAAAMPAEPEPFVAGSEEEALAGPGVYDDDHDEFEEELIAAMTTPIADEDSAAAVVPLLIRGPGELGAMIKIFKFERAFDPALSERADRALDRIMQGIDVPKDVVTGLANVKYSNAVQIDKSMYKAHVEPLLMMICDAITTAYFRQALIAMDQDPELIRKTTIWYDPSDIVIQSDPEELADQGYDRYLISAAAWRRAHGFTEDDKPEGEEIARRMIVEKGQLAPELTEAVLQQIAPALFGQMRETHQEQTGTPLPPEVQQALGTPPSEAPVPAAETPVAPAAPAAPADGAPGPPGGGLPPAVQEALQ
jgi:hypothetical protein